MCLHIIHPPQPAGFFVFMVETAYTNRLNRVQVSAEFAATEPSFVPKNPDHDTHAAKHANGGTPLDGDVIPFFTHRKTPSGPVTVPIEEAVGEVNTTGIVGKTNNDVVAAVRHPLWIDSQEGVQTKGMIEYSFLREFGKEQAADVAKDITTTAKVSTHLPYESSTRGSEVESILFGVTPDTRGRIVSAPLEMQEELQAGVLETALPPVGTIEEGMRVRAQLVVDGFHEKNGYIRVNTSVPIAGDFYTDEQGTRNIDPGAKINEGEYKGYVQTMSQRLLPLMGRHDNFAGQMGDELAVHYGYANLEEMAEQHPDVTFWLNTSAHQSISLPHVKDEKGENVIPSEIAIAVGDINNSNLAKVGSMLMFSSPLLLGKEPTIMDNGEACNPRDGRDLMRRVMATSLPGEMVGNVDELNKRTTEGIVDGNTHTLDRTAYYSTLPDGRKVKSYHGPVRIRMSQPAPDSTIGRVEVTEAGNTFSLLDYYAYTIFCDAMKLAAIEAVAHGQQPSEYYGEKYPLIVSSDKRTAIGDGYNLHGAESPLAREAIQQAHAFMGEVAEKYKPFAKNIRFAQERIANLLEPTDARNFDEYLEDPKGQVSEVMRHMYYDGRTPAEITMAVTKYEYDIARKILGQDGDATEVYKRGRETTIFAAENVA